MENKTSGNLKNTIIAFLFLLVTTVIFGCDDSSSNPSSQDSSEKTKKTETTQSETKTAAADASGSATIGSKGGKVKAGKSVTIKIPEDALDEDKKISVKYIPSLSSKDDALSFSFLGEVEFGPSGTEFKKDAEVTMKLSRTPNNSTISVFHYDEKNKIWDYVTDAAVTDDTVKFKVNHFSKYRCVDISPEVLNKYVDIVKAAKKNKTSDKQITQSYADYLKNDVKVMDSYVEQNGHLYKACGFRIDGAYYIDGEEGDPNELNKKFGKSNKKGNKYGLSKIGSLLYSYADYIKKAEGEKESQDCISIGVIIDYEPVEAYKISGHIEEELELEIGPSEEWIQSTLSPDQEVEVTIKSKGSINLNVEYDFQGTIQLVDGTATGTIKFANADASLSTEKLSYREKVYWRDGGSFPNGQRYWHEDDIFTFFTTSYLKKTNSPDYTISATLSDNKYNIAINENISEKILSICGPIHLKSSMEGEVVLDSDDDFSGEISIGINSDKPLLNFELTEGTKTYTSKEFKDNYSLEAVYAIYSSDTYYVVERGAWEELLTQTSKKTSTKQTITIEYMTEE